MSTSNRFSWFIITTALVAGAVLGGTVARPALGIAQSKEQPVVSAQRYTVVFTEGTNLCVTDNQAKKVYFYTVDQGKEPGSELKLRAFVDLDQVGKDVIKPTLLKHK